MSRILAVDDKQDNLISLVALLKFLMPDCVVITALSGPEGIEKALAEQPDAILLDIQMPGMDGFEACRRLKADARTQAIPVVMITAVRTDAISRVQGLEMGADAFLSKPIDEHELVSQLKVVFRIKAAEDALRAERDSLETLVEKRTADLRKSEAKSRYVLNHSSDLIWELTLNGIITYASPSWFRVTGHNPGLMRDSSFTENVHPEDMPACQKFMSEIALVKQIASPPNYRVRHADGSWHWHEATATPVLGSKGEVVSIVGVSRDITARQKIEAALESSRQRLESMFRAAPVGIGMTQSCVITEANELLSKMTGYTREELVGHSAQMFYFSQEEFDRVGIEKYKQIEATGTGTVETVWKRKDGTRLDVLLSSSVIDRADLNKGFTFTALDITDRKRMQAAIEKRILALTRPLDDTAAIAFDELFDLKEIQRIQDEFADATDVASLITQPDGTPITKPSNFTHLCNDLIRTTEKGCSNCFKSDATLGCYHPDGPIIQPCLSGGLWDAGVSITVANQHVANWLIGQVRNEAQTDEAMRAYAREIGADESEFLKAYHDVPVMSCERFKKIAQALFTLANQLSTAAYLNLQQARFIADEKKSKANLLRLSTAIEQSPEAIVITDVNGTIQYVNPGFEKITGYVIDEALGQSMRVLKSGRHEEAFYQDLWKTISGGKTWTGRFVNKRKNGTFYTEDATISPVLDETRTITNYVAVKRDITEHLALTAQFEQSQKMELVGRLAGGVAHDFNNMLQAILGHTEMALEHLDTALPVFADLLEVRKAAERSANLTQQLLTFARKQTIAPKIVDLNETVEGLLKMLRRLIGEDIDLIWNPGNNLPAIKIDPSQLDQILTNLCVNSQDAIEGVGKITIETDIASFNEIWCGEHPEVKPGDFVQLAVSDTGCGMNSETLGHLFEPFFTTKPIGKGTGLGLATVYGVVSQNNGFILVSSELGHGTTFKIYFPRQVEKPIVTQEKSAIQTTGHGTETILLVEDEPAILGMTTNMLTRMGYTVMSAARPDEAIRLAQESHKHIDLLITDVVMPEMNGRDLASNLHTLYPGLKCLFMSGYTADVISNNGVLDEGMHFIQKPFSMRELEVKIREVLG